MTMTTFHVLDLILSGMVGVMLGASTLAVKISGAKGWFIVGFILLLNVLFHWYRFEVYARRYVEVKA